MRHCLLLREVRRLTVLRLCLPVPLRRLGLVTHLVVQHDRLHDLVRAACHDERNDPADDGPAKQQVQQGDGERVALTPRRGDAPGEEVAQRRPR